MTLVRSAVLGTLGTLGTLCFASGVLLLAQDRPPHPAANNPHSETGSRSAPAWPPTASAAPTATAWTPRGYRGPDLTPSRAA